MTAPTMRDLGRPAEFRDKAHLAAWIAREAGVDIDTVIDAKKRSAKQAGREWRGGDPVGQARTRALHRLRTTTLRRTARHDAGTPEPTEARLSVPDDEVTARARRLMEGLK